MPSIVLGANTSVLNKPKPCIVLLPIVIPLGKGL
jgi:hypothetical protein